MEEAAPLRPRLAAAAPVRQNWVLNPLQDLLLIILAPVLSLALALLAMGHYGAERGATIVITAHVVLTVAHHLPTFIRVYGDVELFRRFRWSFVLGPLVSLAVVGTMLALILRRGYPVEAILTLYILLALWDPWHFLRQHFGFTRIYDRNNAAPPALASNMDWWLCATWFAHIMVASGAWLPGLLEDLHRNARFPLLLAVTPGMLEVAGWLSGAAAGVMTFVYAAYLLWCRQRGYYVSPAKLALLVCTFGVMYLTYTPNDWILALAPAWGFKLGFATVGIVHMTQYLAIVWRYDRRLAQQGRARRGWFAWLHSRRGRWTAGIAAAAYVAVCIAYGEVITTRHDSRIAMAVLLAIGFTSTLMHYYFDGFIWKVRHQQNRAALDLARGGAAVGESWWRDTPVTAPPLRVLGRQLLYFALPLGLLGIGTMQVWQSDRSSYVAWMVEAQRLSEQGRGAAAADAARHAWRRMRDELPQVRRMAELLPTAAREAEYAFLLYNEALYRHRVLPAVDGRAPTVAAEAAFAQAAAEAARHLERAMASPGSLAHPGRESLTAETARAIATSWERQSRS